MDEVTKRIEKLHMLNSIAAAGTFILQFIFLKLWKLESQ
jgi:hypothetical protein